MMSDADCTPGREPRSVAASSQFMTSKVDGPSLHNVAHTPTDTTCIREHTCLEPSLPPSLK